MNPIWMFVLAAAAQDLVETRFDRVHLRNGASVDGRVVREDASGVTLAVKSGEMKLRRDQVDRVERIRMKGVKEPAAPSRKAAPEGGYRDLRESAAPVVAPPPPPARDPFLARLAEASEDEEVDLTNEILSKGPEAVSALADRLEILDARTRRFVSGVVRQARPAEALPSLRKQASARDPEVRAECVALLGVYQQPSLAPDLRTALQDADPRVRAAAIPGLVSIADRDCFETLQSLIQDADPAVRSRAIAGSIDLAARHDLRRDLAWAMRDAVERAEGPAKVEILSSLGQAGLRELEPVVVGFLSDLDPKVRAQAARTLAAMGAASAGELLLTQLRVEREYWPRVQLAEAARTLRLQAAIPDLLSWLDDEDSNIQLAATRSLRALTGQSFGLDRARWHAWWSSVAPR